MHQLKLQFEMQSIFLSVVDITSSMKKTLLVQTLNIVKKSLPLLLMYASLSRERPRLLFQQLSYLQIHLSMEQRLSFWKPNTDGTNATTNLLDKDADYVNSTQQLSLVSESVLQ